ncbi:MAG: sigma-70 family RNA polymerase sigma factor [Myxococcales bacterium]|nr:sigma-70 family RNA polymerase sigma factor [Myxococcales bacterium]
MTSLTAEQRGLVTEHARVVQTVVRRHAARYEGLVSAEELTQAAQLALVAAARAFDPSRGVPFGGFAWKRVEGAVLRIAGREAEARHQRRAMATYLTRVARRGDVLTDTPTSVRAELHDHARCAATAMLLGLVAEDDATAPPDELLLRRERREAVHRALAELDEESRQLVAAHYFERQTLTAIAAAQGATMITTRRRHQRALKRLAELLVELGPR